MNRRKIIAWVLAIVICAGFYQFNRVRQSKIITPPPVVVAPISVWFTDSLNNLYTVIQLKMKTDSLNRGKIIENIDSLFTGFTLSLQSNSKLDSLIFKAQPGDTIRVDSNALNLFKYADYRLKFSDGFINPAIGNLIKDWGLLWGNTPSVPAPEILKQRVAEMTTPFYSFTQDSSALIINRTGVHFALGAFSKGYVIDLASDLLEQHGVEAYMLEIGGDLRVKNTNPTGNSWTLGIRDPDDKTELIGTVLLDSGLFSSMATSGGYEKFFIDSMGIKHHHILNPKTGRSVSDKRSVSAFAKKAIDADFWATYLFVLPYQKACETAQQSPEVEAIIFGVGNKYCMTPAAAKRFSPL
jgi:thiamine biosynthesis lipoprotein